jgi:uncharacterized protein involved in exopolysaccharide biosynthesis
MISLPTRSSTPVQVPREQSRLQADEHHSVDLWPYVDLIWQGRVTIIGITIVAAVIAATATLFMGRQYRAEATVFLTPPTYSTSLRPGVMSVEAYARLAETEHVLALVDAELQRKHADLFASGSTAAGRLASYGARLSASREPQKPYLPLIGLTAVAETPEKARAAANTWADVFITEEGKLARAGKSNSANFILKEYPKAEEAVLKSEDALQTLSVKHAQEIATLKADIGLSLKTAQLEAYEYMVVQQEDALADARGRLDRLKPSVAQLEKELQSTPPFLVVSKAMSDDALWNAQSQSSGGAREALEKAKLLTQEVNPVYTSLSQRVAEQRVELNALPPQIAALQAQIDSTRRTVRETRTSLLDGERRLAEVEGRHAVEAAALQRQIEAAKRSIEKLSEKIGEARLAQSEPDSDLKLGAYAGLPATPSGPSRTLIVAGTTATAFVVSALALLAIAIFRGHLRDVKNAAG